MKNKIVILVFISFSLLYLIYHINSFYNQELKEGDIVFQMTKKESLSLKKFWKDTHWNECGIIIEKDNKLYVLGVEDKVNLIPYEEWRKKGHFNMVKEIKTSEEDIKIDYKKYLGKKNDLSFSLYNNKIYNSELLYLIFKEQFDIILYNPTKIKDYKDYELTDIIKSQNINKEELIIMPCNILNRSEYLIDRFYYLTRRKYIKR